MTTRFLRLAVIVMAALALVLPLSVQADPTVVEVTPVSLQGWVLAPFGPNPTPIDFTTNQASIGSGSLQFGPISGADRLNKFIMQPPYSAKPVGDFVSFSYDFYVGSVGAVQFYVNVYVDSGANGVGTTASWYDCRYDYVPTGSIGAWNTGSFDKDFTDWANVVNPLGNCPASIGGNHADSIIMFMAVNGGDTSLNDTGLVGNYDNIIIDTLGGKTIYDFEPAPTLEEATDALEDYIEGLDLNNGQINALSRKVTNALRSYGRGDLDAAYDQLDALILQATEFEADGVLTSEEAATLISLTNTLKAVL